MPMAMYSLGTVLLITSLHGGYALAGGLSAAGLVGASVFLNRVSVWVDRFGPRRVLLPQSALFFAGTIAFVASAETHAPAWVLFVTGTFGASLLPALGAVTRTGWSTLCGPDDHKLQLALALESANDELIFILGPVLTVLLATRVHPAAGLIAAASLASIGIWFLVRHPCMRADARPDTEGSAVRRKRPADEARRWSLPALGLVTLVPVLAMFGAVTAAIELATVAFATAHGHRALAGLILALFAVGSAGGGLWYGSRKWAAGTRHRLAVAQVLSAIVVALLWFASSPVILCLVLLAAGIVASPILISSYSLLEREAEAGRENEALSWVGVSMCVGGALGAVVAGWSVDAHGAGGGYLTAAACAGLAALVCVASLASRQSAPTRSEERQA
jgi:predicted MFS family arabinose efflux permease